MKKIFWLFVLSVLLTVTTVLAALLLPFRLAWEQAGHDAARIRAFFERFK